MELVQRVGKNVKKSQLGALRFFNCQVILLTAWRRQWGVVQELELIDLRGPSKFSPKSKMAKCSRVIY